MVQLQIVQQLHDVVVGAATHRDLKARPINIHLLAHIGYYYLVGAGHWIR